jgi:hypothetical protein
MSDFGGVSGCAAEGRDWEGAEDVAAAAIVVKKCSNDGMRLFVFLLGSVVVFAQERRDPLQEYLKTTSEQWQQLQINATTYLTATGTSAQRLGALNAEIATETNKPAINPAELGQRYRQVEELCRSLIAPRVELYRKQMQVLTQDQRALLQPLADVLSLLQIDGLAQSLFLSPARAVDPGSLQSGRQFYGPSFTFDPKFGTQKLPAQLIAYLGLTDSQQEQIRLAHLDYRGFFEENFAAMLELGTVIETEIAQETYSAERLGGPYAGIENIRRRIADRESSMRRELNSMLTERQRDLLASAEAANEQVLLKFSGDRLYLFAPEERPRPASTAGFQSRWFTIDSFSRTDGTSVGSNAATSIFRACKVDGGVLNLGVQ